MERNNYPKAMDLIFELLEQIDNGSDDIIFFADEGGSWQVDVDAEMVLPVRYTGLAAATCSREYDQRALEVIEAWGSYDREQHLRVAGKAAN